MTNIKSIDKVNIADQVYDQMRELIANSEWELGTKIPSENELSASFKVSRNTIRSAIQKLKGIGVVETRQGQGTFICKSVANSLINTIIPIGLLSDEDVLEIAQFRKTVEMGSVYYAALNRTEEDLFCIKKALNMMEESVSDPEKYGEADYLFHLAIAKASKNRYFYRMNITLKDIFLKHFIKMGNELGSSVSIDLHKQIYDAIEQKDSEIARLLSERGINLSLKLMKEKMGK